jgi:hypothetical protein
MFPFIVGHEELMADIKDGELFRRNYMRSPAKLADSPRARRRMHKLFDSSQADEDSFVDQVERQLGIEYPFSGFGHMHSEFWDGSEIGDFLSAITIWLRLIRIHPAGISAARQIFQDEDLHYRIDDQGGVHYLVDEPFAYTVESTLAGLGGARFTSARHALDAALKNLSPTKQSGKGLIRGVFEAAESTFLVVCGPDAGNRLNKQAMDKHLKPILLARYAGTHEADDKVTRMLGVFEAWIKDAHPYRHGAAAEQEHEAPLELAILSATSGMGFIRFLAELGVRS